MSGAVADRLPSSLPRPPGELAALRRAWATPKGWRVLSAVNNTRIGLFYIATALVFFLLAGVLALLMRSQLALPANDLVTPQTYNQLFTMHGTVMMFLFAVPVVEAIAVYLLPGMLGARDLPFPRLGAYAYWAYAIGGAVFFGTLFFGVAPDGGWFMYPPLTGSAYSPGPNADWWLLGIGFIEISAIAGAVELIVGIAMTRAPGMTPARMPLFAWAMLVVGVMVVFAFPAVIAGTALLELERALDWPFFIAARGGDPLLWQHLFWFFGHPEVYIIFLPAAGLVSMMLPALAGVPLAGHKAAVWALVAVGVLSFALWAHHMFTAGLGPLASQLVSAASLAIAIPTGVQVFAWLATLARGRLRWTSSALFLVGFLVIFTMGGLTGVMVAVLPFDAQAHDSYFVVAHFHYVLIGGLVFPMVAALYHWTPLVNGHRLSETLGRWVFGLMFAGFQLAFFPMHLAGLDGMPRRVYTYAGDQGWTAWNLLSTVGAFVLAAGVLLLAFDALRTWRRPQRAHGDPWQAPTLEWIAQEDYATRSIAEVEAREPLWHRPGLHQEVPRGQHWLPGSASGGRETLVTGVLDARPRWLLRLPGDSWLPLLAAAGTAGFFLLLTAKQHALAWTCAVAGLAALLAWLWETDRAPPRPRLEVADGVWLQAQASGPRAHSWWAVVVLLLVELTVFASFAFAHLHVSLQSAQCPPPGAALPATRAVIAGMVAWLLGSAAIEALRRLALPRSPARRALHAAAVLLALAASSAAMMVVLWAHLEAGLAPRADAWSATVAALLANQGLHQVVLSVVAVYLAVRLAAGLVGPHSRATLDNAALLWHGTTLQGLAMAAWVQWLPSTMAA